MGNWGGVIAAPFTGGLSLLAAPPPGMGGNSFGGGGYLGGSKKNQPGVEEQYKTAQQQRNIARGLFQETGPLRFQTLSQLGNIMQGGTSPSLQAAYLPARQSIEGQFQNVQNQIKGNLPRGGQLNNALLQSDIGRAQAVGGLEGQLRQGAFNQAMGYSLGQAPALALGGLSQAGGQFGQTAALQQAQVAQKKNKLGQTGMGIGLAAGL